METLKRHSLSGLAGLKGHDRKDKKDKKNGSPALRPTIPRNDIELFVESPPNVFYGVPDRSSGVLFAGIFKVKVVTDPEIVLDTYTAQLYTRITPKKPVSKDCKDCAYKDTEIKKWNFLTEPKTLKHGQHRFPFSHLIPGHLPATLYGNLAQVQYYLEAKATTKTGEELSFRQEIRLARSLAVPPEKTSLRVFPPTRLEVQLSMVAVIHPIGRWTAAFRLSHVTNPKPTKKNELQTRWFIRKLAWQLEEKEHMLSPACSKHASKVGGEGRGKEHEEIRTLARDEVHEGFKADYSNDGEIDLEFPVILTPTGAPHGHKPGRALCDVKTPTGLSISHMLVIELIIGEEWVDAAKGHKTGATGQARVLRAQFGVIITERAGLGIAWDEENPPLYEDSQVEQPPDYQHEFGLPPLTPEARQELIRQARGAMALPAPVIPASPPMYGVNSQMSDYEGPPLDEILDGMTLDERAREARNGELDNGEGSAADVVRQEGQMSGMG